MTPGFDPQPDLKGPNLNLRPMRGEDRAGLYAAASDPLIWEQHPAKTRHQRDVFDPYFDMLLRAGTTLVLRENETNEIVGCSRFYVAPDVPGSISIGYTFLVRRLWGGPANREMKTLMLTHAFRHYDAVWFHIGEDNIRSQKGTAKLGAVYQYTADLDLGGGPSPTVCMRLDRAAWKT